MRYLGADGLMWCSLSGGANDASYLKPPIDFYGYAKQAFYALKEGYCKTVCFNKSVDVVYGNKLTLTPAITGACTGEKYAVSLTVKNADGTTVIRRKFKVIAPDFTFDLSPVELELDDGYYSVEYATD